MSREPRHSQLQAARRNVLPPDRSIKACTGVYTIFRRLADGEFVHVASRDELQKAVQLIEDLEALWPGQGEYVVRDSEGNEINLTN
jgi:hypothetical protein